MSLIIRPALPGDMDAIIDAGVKQRWVTPIHAPNSYRRALETSCTLVAEVNGLFAGYARAISDGVVTTFLCELLVAPDFRGIGIGTRLVDAVQEAFPHTRLDLISDADGFYLKNGFRKLGRGFRRDGKK